MRESCRWLKWMKDAARCCITWWALVSLSDDTCQLQLAAGGDTHTNKHKKKCALINKLVKNMTGM